MRPSIFTLERRENLGESVANLLTDLRQTKVVTVAEDTYKIIDYLEHCLRQWPYRTGAISIDDYLKRVGIDMTAPKDEKDILYILELLINLLKWAPILDFEEDEDDSYEYRYSEKITQMERETGRILENITYILEKCSNMRIREDDRYKPSKYYITRRDSKVDITIEAAPELAHILLGYMDIRNEDDLKYKKEALSTIYMYMEDKRKEYGGLSCSAISEEFFVSMNSLGIRHGTKSQIRIHRSKQKTVYDDLFKMALFVLQTEEVNRCRDVVKAIRSKQK